MTREFSVTVSVSGDEADELQRIANTNFISIAGAAAQCMTAGLSGGMDEDELREKLADVKGLGKKLTEAVVEALV